MNATAFLAQLKAGKISPAEYIALLSNDVDEPLPGFEEFEDTEDIEPKKTRSEVYYSELFESDAFDEIEDWIDEMEIERAIALSRKGIPIVAQRR